MARKNVDSNDDSGSDDEMPNLADEWKDVFHACETGLRAFLRGRLGQEADVDDCLQVVYLKMIQSGKDVVPGARRAWLFRVAANESARFWRRKSTTDRVLERQASDLDETAKDDATDRVILSETTDRLRQAVLGLPKQTQQIIRMRIYDNQTFQQIADELNIPLGTALTRMRRALQKLRLELESETDES